MEADQLRHYAGVDNAYTRGPARLLAQVRGFLFGVVFYMLSIPVASGIALLSPFSKRAVVKGSWLWSAMWFTLARWICGVRLEVRGTPPQGEAIVAIKHQSFYDAITTLYLFDHPVVVMKQALRRIPIWGYVAMRHGVIFVDRNKGGAALKKMLREARSRGAGRPVLIFPEGTRVPVGHAPPLKAGLSAMYAALNRPVVPAAINSGLLWTRGLAKFPGTVTMAFGPAVPAGLPRDEMEARVHDAMNRDPKSCEVA